MKYGKYIIRLQQADDLISQRQVFANNVKHMRVVRSIVRDNWQR